MRLVFLSAFLLILSFPPFDQGWLAWGALVPLLFSLEEVNAQEAFERGLWAGFFFFFGTIWWLSYVTLTGAVLLALYLSLYVGIWSWLARRLIVNGSIQMIGILPAAWAFLEYARSWLFTGFGWNLLGHTQWGWTILIQAADLTGVTGISFLVVLGNIAIYMTIRAFIPRIRSLQEEEASIGFLLAPICIAWGILFLAMTYGVVRYHNVLERTDRGGTVAVAQGNIPQSEKWNEDYREGIWKTYEALALRAGATGPDLVIWPETSVPDYLDEPGALERLRRLAFTIRTSLLTGVAVRQDSGVTNSAVLFGPSGDWLGRYDKIHLVPFGEYLPLGRFLGPLRSLFPTMGDFTAGRDPSVFGRGSTLSPFSVLICFEDVFPGLARGFVRRGAQWLVVITNDAWFRRSAASIQHLQASVFRAVENRVWIARAANTGWSGFIDPTGEVLPASQQVPRFEVGWTSAFLGHGPADSLYLRFGDWFQVVCLGLMGLVFVRFRQVR